jgi:RND family efflux transporter MFP subunit
MFAVDPALFSTLRAHARRAGPVVALLAAAAAAPAFGQAAPGPASARDGGAQSAPSAQPPQRGQRTIRAQLKPRRYTTLAAEIGAKIDAVAVKEGSRFKAGEVMVRFDCALNKAQADKARAALDAATRTWEANQRLNALQSVGKVELDVSQAEVAKAQAEVAGNTAVLGKCAVVAPFAGRVAEQLVREAQYVQPGQALLDILDDSVLELEFLVPSTWMSRLKPGHAFEVAIDETGKSYPARVQRLGARVDPVSQSVKVSAAINGNFPDLVAGMSGQVRIELSEK